MRFVFVFAFILLSCSGNQKPNDLVLDYGELYKSKALYDFLEEYSDRCRYEIDVTTITMFCEDSPSVIKSISCSKMSKLRRNSSVVGIDVISTSIPAKNDLFCFLSSCSCADNKDDFNVILFKIHNEAIRDVKEMRSEPHD